MKPFEGKVPRFLLEVFLSEYELTISFINYKPMVAKTNPDGLGYSLSIGGVVHQ
jgi:hypothetical protein